MVVVGVFKTLEWAPRICARCCRFPCDTHKKNNNNNCSYSKTTSANINASSEGFLCAVVPLVSPLCLLLHLYRSCLSSVSSPSSLPLMSLLCISSMSLRCVSFMPPPSSLSLFSFPLCPLCHLCRAAMKI